MSSRELGFHPDITVAKPKKQLPTEVGGFKAHMTNVLRLVGVPPQDEVQIDSFGNRFNSATGETQPLPERE